MNTLDTLRMFCNSGLSVQDARSIVISIGHEPEAVQEAINLLIMEDISVRHTLTETTANIFLTSKN